MPETGGDGIHRNDAEPLVVWGHEEVADDARDTPDEEGDQKAENHLAQQRRPVEHEKGADAPQGKGRDQTHRDRKTQADEMQAAPHRFGRERVEVAADPGRRPPKHPFDAGAQTDKNGEEQQGLEPPVLTEVCGDAGAAALELARQIGDGTGDSEDVLADPVSMQQRISLRSAPSAIAELWDQRAMSRAAGSAAVSPRH